MLKIFAGLGRSLGLARRDTTGSRAALVERLFDRFNPPDIAAQLERQRGEFRVPPNFQGQEPGAVRPRLNENVPLVVGNILQELRAEIARLESTAGEEAAEAAGQVRDRLEGFIESIQRLRQENRIEGNVNQQLSGFVSQAQAASDRIGELLTVGLTQGVEANQAEAINAVGDAARMMIAEMESVLEIRSPSRVAIRLGEFFAEGFAIGLGGIRDSVGVVEEATRGLRQLPGSAGVPGIPEQARDRLRGVRDRVGPAAGVVSRVGISAGGNALQAHFGPAVSVLAEQNRRGCGGASWRCSGFANRNGLGVRGSDYRRGDFPAC